MKEKNMPAKLKNGLSVTETYCVVTWSTLKGEVFTEIFKYIPAAKPKKTNKETRQIINIFSGQELSEQIPLESLKCFHFSCFQSFTNYSMGGEKKFIS